MGFNDPANDRQTEPGASFALAVASPKTLEDELALGNGNSGASIQDTHLTALLDDNLDVGALSRVIDGVLNAVADGHTQQFRIAPDPDGSAGSSQDNVFALGHRQRCKRLHNFGAHPAEVGSSLGIDDKALQLRHGEELVGDPAHAFDVAP